jgi:pimeloyl-ACP methyl ester carboxylesterase
VIARPEAFASLTLLCSGPAAVDGTRAVLMRRMRGQLLAGGIPRIVALLGSLDGDEFETERMARHDATALLGMGDALLAEPDRVEELAKALAGQGIPALVACGAEDDAWSPTVQQEMASRLGARFASIAGAGHSPAVDQPAATAALLAEFVA